MGLETEQLNFQKLTHLKRKWQEEAGGEQRVRC